MRARSPCSRTPSRSTGSRLARQARGPAASCSTSARARPARGSSACCGHLRSRLASGSRAGRPSIYLRLLGSPGAAEEEAEWRRLIDELGLTEGESVAIEGPVGREAVSAAMRRAELFVHPSPRETFGVVVAEALASGLPVVTTPNGGGDGIVGSDGRFGVVARGMEPEDLAAAIREGLERADSAAFDRDGMRRHVEDAYAAPAVAARTVELYLRLGARPAKSPAAHVAGRPPIAHRPSTGRGGGSRSRPGRPALQPAACGAAEPDDHRHDAAGTVGPQRRPPAPRRPLDRARDPARRRGDWPR